MNKARRAAYDIKTIEDLTNLKSPIHKLCPFSKLLFTIFYIIVVVSFYKYDLSGLFVLGLFPLMGFSLSGVSFGTFLRKLWFALPFVLFVGLFNPFFDKEPMGTLGSFVISGGIISMLTLMLKGLYSLMMSFLLIATTPIEEICGAMRKLFIPKILVVLVLLTYRYISILLDEVGIMWDSYSLRAPGQRGVEFKSWGSFLGQLILRSMDKAQGLYESMLLRGFRGEFDYRPTISKFKYSKLCMFIVALLVLGCRLVNVPVLIGSIVS